MIGRRYSYSLFRVVNNNNRGLLDLSGKMLRPISFDYIFDSPEGSVRINLGGHLSNKGGVEGGRWFYYDFE